MAKIQSVEPNIADLANGWMRSYKLDYKLEQESLNTEIDQALNEYHSKNGGVGGNRPDAKLLLQDKNMVNYPVLIEYKGYKDKLVALDSEGKVANKTAKNQPDFKHINSYAVNGAVHYANALLHYTSYTDIIAIGMTGYKTEAGKLEHEIGVYYVSKSNFGIGQKIDNYTDFSFLKKSNFDKFIEKVKRLKLTPDEIEKLKEQREREINASLVKLNNDIYQNEKGLSERDRVYLVAASIIATLGVPGRVAALEKSELKSSTETGNRDGDIILRKIKAFLDEKNLPQEKRDMIVRTLQNTLTTDNINKVENGESQLKRVFTKIVYATAPKSQVVGEAEIECVLVGKPTEIWKKTKCGSGIPASFFKEYYKSREVAVAYKLTNVKAYETPKALKDYGVTHVPQSFIYLKQKND